MGVILDWMTECLNCLKFLEWTVTHLVISTQYKSQNVSKLSQVTTLQQPPFNSIVTNPWLHLHLNVSRHLNCKIQPIEVYNGARRWFHSFSLINRPVEQFLFSHAPNSNHLHSKPHANFSSAPFLGQMKAENRRMARCWVEALHANWAKFFERNITALQSGRGKTLMSLIQK